MHSEFDIISYVILTYFSFKFIDFVRCIWVWVDFGVGVVSGRPPPRAHFQDDENVEKNPTFAHAYACWGIYSNMRDINHDVDYLI